VRPRRRVELTLEDAGSSTHGAADRVDMDRLHERQVDDEPVVHDGGPRGSLGAAEGADRKVVHTPEAKSGHDVVHVRRARDESRAPVDHPQHEPSWYASMPRR
jgi:hypothetical protein